MIAQIAVYGRLVNDSQAKQTSEGIPMTLARMMVLLPYSQTDGGTVMVWLSVLVSGRQTEALERHCKGGLLSVAGNIRISQWTGQSGEMRQGWQVITDSVISA